MSDTEDYSVDSVDGRRTDEGSVRASVGMASASEQHRNVILDDFSSLEEVRDAIMKQGLDTCSLIFGMLKFTLYILYIFIYE